jgi:hypothetical protein
MGLTIPRSSPYPGPPDAALPAAAYQTLPCHAVGYATLRSGVFFVNSAQRTTLNRPNGPPRSGR